MTAAEAASCGLLRLAAATRDLLDRHDGVIRASWSPVVGADLNITSEAMDRLFDRDDDTATGADLSGLTCSAGATDEAWHVECEYRPAWEPSFVVRVGALFDARPSWVRP